MYSIALADNGVYWFGTNHGVTRHDGNTWLTYDSNNGLLDDDVYTIVPAPNGDIWVGTRRGVTRIGNR